MSDDIAASIDAGNTSQRAELGQHPLGAALLKERGSGYAAQLQMLLVDPLLLPDEPLQSVAKRRGISQIACHF